MEVVLPCITLDSNGSMAPPVGVVGYLELFANVVHLPLLHLLHHLLRIEIPVSAPEVSAPVPAASEVAASTVRLRGGVLSAQAQNDDGGRQD